MKKRHKKMVRVLSWFVFAIYLVALVYFLFFCEQMGRVPSDDYKYSLVPFREIKRCIVHWRAMGLFHAALNLVGNVLCFVPFGFVLPIMSRRHRGIFKITFLSFLASLLVELIQLVSKVGSCDVDDIILNTLGGFLGYLAFWIGLCVIRHRDAVEHAKESRKE